MIDGRDRPWRMRRGTRQHLARATRQLQPLIAAASRVAAVPAQHLRWKVILPYALLVLVLAGVATYLVTRVVVGSLGERFDNQLVEASRVAADGVVRRERKQLEVVRAVAFTEGLAAAVQSDDAAGARELARGAVANAGIERLEILRADGSRLTTFVLSDTEGVTYEEISDTDDTSNWSLVRSVLAPTSGAGEARDKEAAIVETSAGQVLYTASPVYAGETVVGAVLAGTTLHSLVREIKQEALADITLYESSGEPLGTTFVIPGATSESEADLGVPGDLLPAIGTAGVTLREHRPLWGHGYDLVYSPLVVRGRNVGIYSVGLPTDFIFAAQSDARWQMALLFGLGMASVLAVGLILARVITEPLFRVIRMAERVSAGDFTARATVTSRDEIGKLAAAINQMTDRMQGQYLASLRALASALAGSDPATLGHSIRVGQLALMLGRHMDLDDKTLAQLEIGGYLHDIGRIGIRDKSLLKRDALADLEREFFDDHPHIRISTNEHENIERPVLAFVESQDFRGKEEAGSALGEDLPLIARIVTVADMYDALTLPRNGGRRLSQDEALAIIRSHAGRGLHFGTVEKLAVILPEWERRRESEPGLAKADLTARNGS